jgi:hypothetical protein
MRLSRVSAAIDLFDAEVGRNAGGCPYQKLSRCVMNCVMSGTTRRRTARSSVSLRQGERSVAPTWVAFAPEAAAMPPGRKPGGGRTCGQGLPVRLCFEFSCDAERRPGNDKKCATVRGERCGWQPRGPGL